MIHMNDKSKFGKVVSSMITFLAFGYLYIHIQKVTASYK